MSVADVGMQAWQSDAARCPGQWNANAAAWTELSRAGFDLYRNLVNTPAFFPLLPPVDGLLCLDLGCGEGHDTCLLARVARSVKELLVFLEDEMHARGVVLEIMTGVCAGVHRPNGATIADRLLFAVAALAAEMERELIRERTLDGLRAAAAAGRHGGRPPPSPLTSSTSPAPARPAASPSPPSPLTSASAAPPSTALQPADEN